MPNDPEGGHWLHQIATPDSFVAVLVVPVPPGPRVPLGRHLLVVPPVEQVGLSRSPTTRCAQRALKLKPSYCSPSLLALETTNGCLW